jgi:hypothetical protein
MGYLKPVSAAVVLVLAACAASPNGGPGGSEVGGSGPSERVFGTIAYYGEPAQVEVPGSVRQGQPFTMSVTTYGNSCVEKGETKVEVEALRAEVRPYDYDTSSFNGGGCDMELRAHKHMVTLSFEETGTAEVVLYGLKEGAGGVTQTSVTRTVEVR